MTTFAYRDGVLASDTAVSMSGTIMGSTTKIVQRGDYFAAASGNAAMAQRFISWFRHGMLGPPPSMLEGEEESRHAYGYIFTPTDMVICFEPGGIHHHSAPYIADGSGMLVALGAMAVGASAIEAVKAACLHDVHSRTPITVLKRKDIA